MPPKVRALLALGTLTTLVAVATLQPLPHVWGQDKEAPPPKVEQKAEEKAEEKTEEAPVKGEEKAPDKQAEEPAPVKEGEVKQEGRGEKTEKAPMKGEEKAPEKTEEKAPIKQEGRGPRKTEGKEPMKEEGDVPRKVEGKAPMKEEGRVPRKTEGKEPMKEEGKSPEGRRMSVPPNLSPVPRKVEGKVPEGRPVPRKGDPEVSKDPVPGRVRPVPGKEDPKGGQVPFNGGISFDAKKSSTCGKGQICYNYALPTMKTPAGIITGTLVMTLNIYQNGNPTPLVFTPPALMQSGVLKDGDHYCFEVDPATFPGIDLNAGGFDFVVSAKFSLNGTDTTILVGSAPQGVVLNKNNDYRIECETPTGTKGEIVYDGRTSTTCGKGQICFNLKLPTMKDEKGNVITATGEIHLTLFQNGNAILSLPPSGPLNDKTGTRYCFPIDPANMKGLDCDLGGFDFVATATFTFGLAGVAPTSATVGTRPNGIFPERNNDYKCECEPGTETDGKIVYDGRTSTTCGKGQICFNLKLPTMKDPKGNVITATGVIHVTLYQNGQAVLSLPASPVLSDKTGTRYCFPIDPANMKGLNCDLGGFDFVATATFDFGEASTASSKGICGIAPDGIIEGVNNDYQCECPPGGGTKGEIVYDERTSTTCGRGKICFYLKMPTVMDLEGNTYTSTGVINVTIFQNGVAMLSLPASPVLSDKTGTKYCFPIDPPDPTNPADPTNLPNLNPNLGGFDFVATATFTFGGMAGIPPTSATVGSAPVGIIAEVNNDYQIKCIEPPVEPKKCGCCPGKELVENGDFELGGGENGSGVHSEYEWISEYTKMHPGTYSVDNVGKIDRFCKNWILPRECKGTKDFSENVLIVNGQTNQPAGSTAVIWSQQIFLPSGEKEAAYHLCFRYLPLPQCCFDIQAKPYVLVNGGKIPLTDHCDEDNGCGRIYAATFHGAGTVNVQIVLPEDGKGDGNDLLIDNISMVKIEPVPSAVVDFDYSAAGTGGTKDVTLTANSNSLTSPAYTWWWEMWDVTTSTPVLLQTVPGNPGNVTTVTFPGLLQRPKKYLFKLKAESECQSRAGSMQDWDFGPTPTARSAKGKSVVDPNPEPLNRKTIRAANPEAVKREKGPLPAKRSE